MSQPIPDHPPARRTQAERTDEARSSLIEAAIELISQRGLAGVTLSDVGARAGYSRGLAVYHFGSKTGLILAVFDHVRDLAIHAIQAANITHSPTDKVVLSLFDAIAATAKSAPALYRATTAMLIDGAMSPDPEVRARTMKADEQALEAIQALIASSPLKPCINRSDLARAILNYIYGVQMRAFMLGNALDVEAELMSVKSFADGFLVAPSDPSQD